jgi:hypothetical protein
MLRRICECFTIRPDNPVDGFFPDSTCLVTSSAVIRPPLPVPVT